MEAELVLYDLNGNVINQMPLTNNFGEKGLSVNVELLRTKNVDLNISVSGKPAEGYVYSGWSSKPEKIQVCGTKEVLSNLNTIEIPASAISIEGASASKEVTIDIEKYLPQDVSLVDESGNKIAVKLLIEKEDSKTIELFPEAVQIKNLSENLKAELIEGKDLELSFTGDEELLRVLDIRDAAFIDLKNYTRPGKYSVPVTIETVPGVTLLNNPTVTVLLTEKKSDNE